MEVSVNKTEWEGLDPDTQAMIQKIIGANFKDIAVVGDAQKGASKELVENGTQSFKLSNPFCSAACGIAEAAAVAACSAISGGIGVAVCVAAAHAAGEFCRSKC